MLVLVAVGHVTAQKPPVKPPRTQRPDWSSAPGTDVFFDDAFAEALAGSPPAAAAIPEVALPEDATATTAWSGRLPVDVIENEVKASYQELLRAVRTPAVYRRSQLARCSAQPGDARHVVCGRRGVRR